MLASACKIMLRNFGSDDLIQALAALADPAWSPPPAESPPPASDPKKRKADDQHQQGPSGSRPRTAPPTRPPSPAPGTAPQDAATADADLSILSQALQWAPLDSADQSQPIVDWSGSTLVGSEGDITAPKDPYKERTRDQLVGFAKWWAVRAQRRRGTPRTTCSPLRTIPVYPACHSRALVTLGNGFYSWRSFCWRQETAT